MRINLSELTKLKEIYRISTLETAGFDTKVKEKIRLWAQTWISDPLEEIIKAIENREDK